MHRINRLAIVGLATASIAAAATLMATAYADTSKPTPGTYVESFETGLGAWQKATDGRARDWDITRGYSAGAKDGDYVANHYIDGTLDDGTIWLQRRVPAPAGVLSATVKISFWLASESAGVTSWPVVAYAGPDAPRTEQDLPRIGETDQVAGWARYDYTTRTTPDRDGQVWVAVGISATWEVQRTYPIDLVTVTVG